MADEPDSTLKLIKDTATQLMTALKNQDVPQTEDEWTLHIQAAYTVGILDAISTTLKAEPIDAPSTN